MNGSELVVERISSLDELLAIRGEWDRLQSATNEKHVMLDHQWVSNWWRHFGADKELHVLLVRKGMVPVGIAPLMISRGREVFPTRESYIQIADDFRYVPGGSWRRVVPIRRLSFPLSIHSGNLRSHFLAESDARAVTKCILGYCKSIESKWDLMMLEGIPAGSEQLQLIRELAPQLGLRLGKAVGSRTLLRSTLPPTFEEFLANRTSRFRKRLRKECRLTEVAAEQAGKLEVRCLRGADVEANMARFLALEARTWKVREDRQRRLYLGLDDSLRAFYSDIAAAYAREDRAQILLLEIGGDAVAGLFTLEREGMATCLLTFMVSDVPYELSITPIWREFFRLSTEQGLREIDFNGKTENLIKWADDELEFERVLLFNSRPYSRLLGFVSDGARRLSNSLRRSN